MTQNSQPVSPIIRELAELCSFTIGERHFVDWASIEQELGLPLPREYKEYAEIFPDGNIRRLHVAHPFGWDMGRRYELVEEIRDVSSGFRAIIQTLPLPYTFYPEPGGLLPWANVDVISTLCWLTTGDDPDRWPVVAYGLPDYYEVVDGSTLRALIRVLKGEAAREVFDGDFLESPLVFTLRSTD